MKITFEKFKQIMKHIVAFEEFQDRMAAASREYNNITKDMVEFEIPSTTFDTVDVLSMLLDDKSKWIGYWVYELDCGRDWEEGAITDEQGNDIPLHTIEDLWSILNMNNDNLKA